jgi:hypothetical protein
MTGEKTIDAYIEGLDDWRAAAVRALVDTIQRTAPEARGSIKWAQPVFDVNGPCIWIKAHARNVNIGFWRGAEFEDSHRRLSGDGDRMRHVTVREGESIDEDALTDYIRQAVALNRAKGDPTRRRAAAQT